MKRGDSETVAVASAGIAGRTAELQETNRGSSCRRNRFKLPRAAQTAAGRAQQTNQELEKKRRFCPSKNLSRAKNGRSSLPERALEDKAKQLALSSNTNPSFLANSLTNAHALIRC